EVARQSSLVIEPAGDGLNVTRLAISDELLERRGFQQQNQVGDRARLEQQRQQASNQSQRRPLAEPAGGGAGEGAPAAAGAVKRGAGAEPGQGVVDLMEGLQYRSGQAASVWSAAWGALPAQGFNPNPMLANARAQEAQLGAQRGRSGRAAPGGAPGGGAGGF